MLLVASALAGDVQADLHLDTPTQMFRKNQGFDASGMEAGLAELKAGGTNLAIEVLWPPRDVDAKAHMEALLGRMEADEARLDAVALARTPADARRIVREGRVAIAYAIEGAQGVGDEAALRRYRDRGLVMLGLTWSFSNQYAGSSGDKGGGLTPDGRSLVAAAQSMGVLIDVSHASKQTTLEVCRMARAPVVASHSNAAAVHAHVRNLSDEEITCIAATGGVIGLNLHGPFVGDPAGVKRAADHVEHLRNVGGIGVVALGSDYDGIITPPADLKTARDLGRLWAELRQRGWSEAALDAVRGENFLRAWSVARSLAGL